MLTFLYVEELSSAIPNDVAFLRASQMRLLWVLPNGEIGAYSEVIACSGGTCRSHFLCFAEWPRYPRQATSSSAGDGCRRPAPSPLVLRLALYESEQRQYLAAGSLVVDDNDNTVVPSGRFSKRSVELMTSEGVTLAVAKTFFASQVRWCAAAEIHVADHEECAADGHSELYGEEGEHLGLCSARFVDPRKDCQAQHLLENFRNTIAQRRIESRRTLDEALLHTTREGRRPNESCGDEVSDCYMSWYHQSRDDRIMVGCGTTTTTTTTLQKRKSLEGADDGANNLSPKQERGMCERRRVQQDQQESDDYHLSWASVLESPKYSEGSAKRRVRFSTDAEEKGIIPEELGCGDGDSHATAGGSSVPNCCSSVGGEEQRSRRRGITCHSGRGRRELAASVAEITEEHSELSAWRLVEARTKVVRAISSATDHLSLLSNFCGEWGVDVSELLIDDEWEYGGGDLGGARHVVHLLSPLRELSSLTKLLRRIDSELQRLPRKTSAQNT